MKYQNSTLRLTFKTLTSDLAENASIPVNIEGAYVDTIMKNGPADKDMGQF